MTEAEPKKTISDYLQNLQNMELLIFHRLNSGVAWVGVPPGKLRKIQLCEAGTADFIIIMKSPGYSDQSIVVYIETKGKGKLPSKVQREFKAKVFAQGAIYVICYDVADLHSILSTLNSRIAEAAKLQ